MRLGGDLARTLAEKSETTDWARIGADPFNLHGAWVAMVDHMLAHPDQMTAAQFDLWRKYIGVWNQALTRLSGGNAPDIVAADPTDRRFRAEAWHRDAIFAFIRQTYLLTARWIMGQVDVNAAALEPEAARKLQFFTRNFIDALSPANFAWTNPEVVRETLESGGQNLVRGLKNLVDDMKRGALRTTDEKAFKVGENLATTKGQVVFRNRLMELIQYAPTTKQVAKTPLLIVPPWINKYYILDLRPDNSFVKWAVDQGQTVFMVSWVNPDQSLGNLGFDDYMLEGILAALDAVESRTGEKQTNVIGYCIGGTLLAMTLSYLKKKKKAGRVASATFFTTLLDFADSGDLKLFVDEEQLRLLRERMHRHGFLDAETLKATFSLLRANDMIWSFVVNNYLMGREPFPFDLLYWNADSTNLPARMHEYYLRHMYLRNDLRTPGKLEFAGSKIDLGRIDTPAYFLSAREDHIAPWKATYAGTQLLGGPSTFVLAASGHIAGVVNHPAAKKYCYWTGRNATGNATTPDAYIKDAKQHEGSWWPHWRAWLKQYEGPPVAARDPAKGKPKPLCPAPGTYVLKKA